MIIQFRILLKIFCFFLPAVLIAQSPQFGSQINMGLVESPLINEASGLAASRKNTDVLWTHNDSGDKNRIFALNTNGKHLGIYQIGSYIARDWEDIAIGPGPENGEDCLYIGDIGDNGASHTLNYIYRILEPAIKSDQAATDTLISNNDVATIVFRYPDGPRNAEALMVDPVTKDIYIISKHETKAHVYLAPYPQLINKIFLLKHVATLNLSYVVAADISATGKEILIKTYMNIFYWQRNLSDTLWQVLTTTPDTLPYSMEPQGESVCWAGDEKGYYTLSEEPFNLPAYLYFYPRLNSTRINKKLNNQDSFYLKQNYPNPFNGSTNIDFSIAQPGSTQLIIYNRLGRLVKSLVDCEKYAGVHTTTWDGKNSNGDFVSSGMYFYLLKNGNELLISKPMIFIK